ncbi:MAG TPA: O-antigen ligase family protein [Oculatellaceae cyanobacterium]
MIDALINTFALSNLDPWWRTVVSESLVGKTISALHKSALLNAPAVGNILQNLAFAAVALLFGILAAPWFADDKNVLALMTSAAAGLWLLGYLLHGKEERRASGVDITVWLFLAINVIAAASSHYLSASIHGLQKLVVYIIAYFLFTAVFQQSTKRKYIVLGLLFLCAIAVSLHGFYQYHIHVAPLATWEDPTVESGGTRIYGTLKNPNLLAGYLISIAPIACGFGIAGIARKNYLVAAFGLVTAAMVSVATIFTGCRGAYIGLFFGFGTIIFMLFASLWKTQPSRRVWLAMGCLILPVLALLAMHFAVPGFDQRVGSIFVGGEHSSNAYRLYVWRASINMFKDNWWLGVGPGNQAFVLAYGLYMKSGFDALGTYCVPLEVGVEAGVMAILSFAALIVALFARGHKCFWLANVEPGERWLAGGAVAALMAMMVQGIADTVFYRPQVQFIFWLLVAILVTSQQKTKETD